MLVRHLFFNPDHNRGIDARARAIAQENKWRAQRYGVGGSFATDEGAVTIGDFLERLIAMTAEDSKILGCTEEVAHCRTIVSGGTSADAQLAIFAERNEQDGTEAALAAVAGWVAQNTARG